jgi:hypothetical protein
MYRQGSKQEEGEGDDVAVAEEEEGSVLNVT